MFKFFSRALQNKLETIQQEKLALQDRLRALVADNERLRDERDAATARAESSTKLVANWLAVRTFGVPIYTDIETPTFPDAPAPTSEETFATIARRGRTGRDVVKEHTEFFQSEYAKVMGQ